MRAVSRWAVCCLVFVGALTLAAVPVLASAGPNDGPARGSVAPALRQFTSGGHILGFSSDGYVVSNGAYALRVGFADAARVEPVASETVEAKSASKTAPMGRVTYRNLWPGISVDYDAPRGGIVRSTWRLAPGADPSAIRLRVNLPLVVNRDGSLRLAVARSAALTETAPVAWQDVAGRRTPVAVRFDVGDDGEVGFVLGSYDTSRPLVIDPTLLWNTFLGGDGDDAGLGIAVDVDGNAYVVGTSDASWGSPVLSFVAPYDAFVAKLNPSGGLEWTTFLGSDSGTEGNAIAVSGGNVYVVGDGVGDWSTGDTTVVGYHGSGSTNDAFVAKLNSTDGALQWHTFLGSDNDDAAFGVAEDGGTLYVTGVSTATWGSPILGFPGLHAEAFVAALSASDGSLGWNTFLGSANANDIGTGIVVDSGSVYVVGISGDTWGSSPLRSYGGNQDAFVAKLDSSGALLWNTFLGGSTDDFGEGIAAYGGNLYVTGESYATWGSPVRSFVAGVDGYVAALDPTGELVWNTFLGGSGDDWCLDIAANAQGIVVTGHSNATWGSPSRPYGSGGDDSAIVAMLSSNGALSWNTFLDGGTSDDGQSIAAADGNVYVTGVGQDTWGAPILAHSAGPDAFVAVLNASQAIPTLSWQLLAALGCLLALAGVVAVRRS